MVISLAVCPTTMRAVIEPPALPPVPHGTRQAPDHSSYGGFDMDSISGAHASAPPPPPFAPPPAAPSYPSHPTQPSAPPPPPPPSSSAHDTARPAYQAPPPPTPSAPAAVPYHQPPQPAAQPAASYMVAAPLTKPPLQAIQEAQKKARYAVSALSFEDVATAVDNLQQALRLLTQQR